MQKEGVKILGFRHELQIFDIATGKLIDSEVKFNRIPQAGLDFLIQSPFGVVAPIPSFYCALYSNNFLADGNTSAADLPGAMGEFTAYSEATRPAWVHAYNGAGALDNAASKAIFTPTADGVAYGSVIIANPTKGATTGLLLSVVRYSTIKPLSAGLEAKLLCGITYIPTNVI
jgi:hypothetical protein